MELYGQTAEADLPCFVRIFRAVVDTMNSVVCNNVGRNMAEFKRKQYVQGKCLLEVIWQYWKLARCEAKWIPSKGPVWLPPDDEELEMLKDAERQIWTLDCWTAVEKLNVFLDPSTWAKKQSNRPASRR